DAGLVVNEGGETRGILQKIELCGSSSRHAVATKVICGTVVCADGVSLKRPFDVEARDVDSDRELQVHARAEGDFAVHSRESQVNGSNGGFVVEEVERSGDPRSRGQIGSNRAAAARQAEGIYAEFGVLQHVFVIFGESGGVGVSADQVGDELEHEVQDIDLE